MHTPVPTYLVARYVPWLLVLVRALRSHREVEVEGKSGGRCSGLFSEVSEQAF